MAGERRVGRFVVSGLFRERAEFHGEGINLFDRMIVLHVEDDVYRHRTLYYAWHPDFAPLRKGLLVPMYEPVFLAGSTVPTWVLSREPFQ